ncbi:MAG: hypothetical protein ACI86M_003607 [Saprospiraceae bacterium]|jgi:hypothetical protein
MEMAKNRGIKYSVELIILGCFFNANAWTVTGPQPINTVFLLIGFFVFLVGLI